MTNDTMQTTANNYYTDVWPPTLIMSLIDWTRASAALLSWELASSHDGSGKAPPSDFTECCASLLLDASSATSWKLFEFSKLENVGFCVPSRFCSLSVSVDDSELELNTVNTQTQCCLESIINKVSRGKVICPLPIAFACKHNLLCS